MRVSFDYDGTLSHVHNLVERFRRIGDEVFIVTSRKSGESNYELFSFTDALQISRDNVYFTEGELKLETLQKLNINLHFDDDSVEVDEINQNSNTCKALLVNFKHHYSND